MSNNQGLLGALMAIKFERVTFLEILLNTWLGVKNGDRYFCLDYYDILKVFFQNLELHHFTWP